jgi:hypothetical protein
MMTAFALARICQALFGDIEYATIDTDRNKYPIGKYSFISRTVGGVTPPYQGKCPFFPTETKVFLAFC